MRRRWHTLRANHASDQPVTCIWFDTESLLKPHSKDTEYHELRFGYACYMSRHRGGDWTDEEWLRFDTRTAFWSWVTAHTRPKTKLYLFCHNTSFDLPVLDMFHELPARGFTLRSAIIDAPPTIIRFRRDSQCIMILDTLNIWRMPLKYVGEEIGTAKLQMPEDNDLSVDWETYGKRDVEILRDACIRWWKFLRDNDYGSFAPTLAGQSMRVFRHKYMKHKIIIDADKRSLDLTREGYYGARCECFRVGKFTGRYFLVDVNSMYPSVMAYNTFPRRLASYTRYATVADLRNWLDRYSLTARVLLRTNIPFAPTRHNNKLVFPIGEFETILQTPELKYAMENAEILEIKEVALYDQDYLFTEMMLDLYRKRIEAKQNGDRVSAFMYRKIMNSFYGKWGQSGNIWIEQSNIPDLSYKHWIVLNYEDKKIEYWRQLGGLQQKNTRENESRDSFPAIAAHITAYARIRLWEFLVLAGLDNTYYCDTDSLLLNEQGYANIKFLVDAQAMGKLSVKGEYDTVQIWACKDYVFGDVERHKGVRKDAEWLDSNTVKQLKWSGLRGLVRANNYDKPLTARITKRFSRLYDKGVVLADGSVLPLTFPEPQPPILPSRVQRRGMLPDVVELP